MDFPIREEMIRDLIGTIHWMTEHGYYISNSSDSLFWDRDREQVVLADYRFLDV